MERQTEREREMLEDYHARSGHCLRGSFGRSQTRELKNNRSMEKRRTSSHEQACKRKQLFGVKNRKEKRDRKYKSCLAFNQYLYLLDCFANGSRRSRKKARRRQMSLHIHSWSLPFQLFNIKECHRFFRWTAIDLPRSCVLRSRRHVISLGQHPHHHSKRMSRSQSPAKRNSDKNISMMDFRRPSFTGLSHLLLILVRWRWFPYPQFHRIAKIKTKSTVIAPVARCLNNRYFKHRFEIIVAEPKGNIRDM